ncbi:hypothetical protein OH492_10690 [Vibrio chagasii]|nr:hypothetical protein [Vibrio chagasii]
MVLVDQLFLGDPCTNSNFGSCSTGRPQARLKQNGEGFIGLLSILAEQSLAEAPSGVNGFF